MLGDQSVLYVRVDNSLLTTFIIFYGIKGTKAFCTSGSTTVSSNSRVLSIVPAESRNTPTYQIMCWRVWSQ